MTSTIIAYFAALITTLALDGTWLSIMGKRFYTPQLSDLMAATPSIPPVVVFYLFYAIGITYFVVLPAVGGGYPLLKTFLIGAFLGCLAYAAYDLTNQATLKDWPFIVTVVDLAWGTVLTATVSVVATLVTRYFA